MQGSIEVFRNRKSPYLIPNRLQDVLASLQFLGTYKRYKLKAERWEKWLAVAPLSASSWDVIFTQHPEFFRRNAKDEISLVWRRSLPKRYQIDTGRMLTEQEIESMDENRISRPPLDPSSLATLLEIAIRLQSEALEQKRERRWWVPVIVSISGVLFGFIGAMLGAMIAAP